MIPFLLKSKNFKHLACFCGTVQFVSDLRSETQIVAFLMHRLIKLCVLQDKGDSLAHRNYSRGHYFLQNLSFMYLTQIKWALASLYPNKRIGLRSYTIYDIMVC